MILILANLMSFLATSNAVHVANERLRLAEADARFARLAELSRVRGKGVHSMSFTFRAAEQEPDGLEEGVLALMPAPPNGRIDNLKKTIRWLNRQDVPIDCIVYETKDNKLGAYQPSFLKACKVIKATGQRWMDHILEMPLSLTKRPYVLHIMDNIEVQEVDLRRMITAMIENDLVRASPALYGKFVFPQVMPHLGFGRKVVAAEFQFDLFTRENFACLQDLVNSKGTRKRKVRANRFGWWAMEAMTVACPGDVGVIDAMRQFKFAPAAIDSAEAYRTGREWLEDFGWQNISTIDLFVSGEPLKGDLFDLDPQCDGEKSCVCPLGHFCDLD